MNAEQARQIQPGDVVYFGERGAHYVVGRVQPTGIAAPLFHLEAMGREDVHDDPGLTSYKLCSPPRDGAPTRFAYRGGRRYSERTLRGQGEPLHPIPGDEVRPDEAYLDGPALRRRRHALGLSQGKLARALGVEPNTIARWERGEKKIANPVMMDLALRALEREQQG
jgi:DNA-binding XRE family transcriptional regulator